MKNDEIKPYCVKQMNNKVEGGPGKGRWGGGCGLETRGRQCCGCKDKGGGDKV